MFAYCSREIAGRRYPLLGFGGFALGMDWTGAREIPLNRQYGRRTTGTLVTIPVRYLVSVNVSWDFLWFTLLWFILLKICPPTSGSP